MNKLWENISYILISSFIIISVFLIGFIIVNYDENKAYNSLLNNSKIFEKSPNNEENKKFIKDGSITRFTSKSYHDFPQDDPSALDNKNNQQEDSESTTQSFQTTSHTINSGSPENTESTINNKNNQQEDSESTTQSFQTTSHTINLGSPENTEPRTNIVSFGQRHFYNPNFFEFIQKVLNFEVIDWGTIPNLHPEDLFSFFKEEPDKFFTQEQRNLIIKSYLDDYNIRRLLKEYIRQNYINFQELFKFGFTWEQLAFYFDFLGSDFPQYIREVLEGKKIVWKQLSVVYSHDLFIFFDEEPDKFFTQEQRNLIIKSYLDDLDVRGALKVYIEEDSKRFSKLLKFGFTWEKLAFCFGFKNRVFYKYIKNVLKGKPVDLIDSKNLNYHDVFRFFIQEPDHFLTKQQRNRIIQAYLSDDNIKKFLKHHIYHDIISISQLFEFGFTWQQLEFCFQL
ncbi:hypothetical protein [Candidatus Phytoplasma gossypii]|uniref:Uncharacterized protein n=1 Tax=Candidatus Phytoplasma gossypii TaxID=2982629 RepID=A0ABT9D053_9MOLU|nr:hypothetical protein ['Gossypium sp.' phytoplasma]MDO8057116.1 hypothetical protein ['Gossypium sp.' phytoplasma]